MEKPAKTKGPGFSFAFKGVATAFKTQWNVRFHFVAAVGVIIGGFVFQVSRLEWVALILTVALVLVAELLNTAIEFLTDLVSPEWNELAGKTKDVSAGAVLIAAISASLVALLIFGPKIIVLLASA